MIYFNLKQYWKYTGNYPIGVASTSEKYTTKEQIQTHQYLDKIIKEALSDKREFLEFMEKYMEKKEFKDIGEEDIEKCDKEFITSQFKKRESDIIYYVEKLDAYIIIEHQSKIDYKMATRMAEYCIELTIATNRNPRTEEYPQIGAIVLYTGSKPWDADLVIRRSNISGNIFGTNEYQIYNIIDLNKYPIEELIAENTAISKVLLFEKIRSIDEANIVLKKLSQKKLTEKEKEFINKIFLHSNKIREIIPNDDIEKFKNVMEGGDEEMGFEDAFVELIQEKFAEARKAGLAEGRAEGIEKGRAEGIEEGIEKGRAEGIEEGRAEERAELKVKVAKIIKKMFKKKMDEKSIMELTGFTREELEKIKLEA